MLKILSMLSMVVLASSLGLSAPAHAETVYTFTSSQGDFVYISPSYKSSGILGLGELYSYSFPPAEDINAVAFSGAQGSYSTIDLGFDNCLANDTCFTHDFGPNGFFVLGIYHELGTDATLVVSNGIPEASTWAMMMLGFAGLGAAWRLLSARQLCAIPPTA
jgi:PEP-CTERM motif